MTIRKICALVFLLGTLAVIGAVQAASGTQLRVQVVDQNGVPVREAVVEIDPGSGSSGPIRFPWRMAMAQKNMAFVPGTLVVAKGSSVAFPNLDTVRHSIYSFSKAAPFKIELYGRDQTRKQAFPIAGSVALGCNIHDGMRGYIRVVDTPFASKTDGNGYVTIAGLPAKTVSVIVWHPHLRAPNNELARSIKLIGGANSLKLPVRLR